MERLLISILLLATPALAAEKKILIQASTARVGCPASALARYRAAGAPRQRSLSYDLRPNSRARWSMPMQSLAESRKEEFPTAKKLKWVQTISAGVEAYSFWPEFVKSNVQLTNCKVVQGPTIADHAFALLLALTRGLHEYIPNRPSASGAAGAAPLKA